MPAPSVMLAMCAKYVGICQVCWYLPNVLVSALSDISAHNNVSGVRAISAPLHFGLFCRVCHICHNCYLCP